MAKKVPNPVDKHVGSRVSKSFRLGVRTMVGARDASTAAAVYVRALSPRFCRQSGQSAVTAS